MNLIHTKFKGKAVTKRAPRGFCCANLLGALTLQAFWGPLPFTPSLRPWQWKNAQLFAELIKTSIKSIAGAQLFFKLLKLGYNITIAVKEQSKRRTNNSKGNGDDKNGTANVCGLNFKGCSQRDVPKSTKLIRAATRSAQKGWQLLPSSSRLETVAASSIALRHYAADCNL